MVEHSERKTSLSGSEKYHTLDHFCHTCHTFTMGFSSTLRPSPACSHIPCTLRARSHTMTPVKLSTSMTTSLVSKCAPMPPGSSGFPVHQASRCSRPPGSSGLPNHQASRIIRLPGSSGFPVHQASRCSRPPGSSGFPVHQASRFIGPPESSGLPVHQASRFIRPPGSSKLLMLPYAAHSRILPPNTSSDRSYSSQASAFGP